MNKPMPKSVFILGGASSGKSALALRLAGKQPGRKIFIATAQAGDQEMARRIERHQAERGSSWVTVEEPVALAAALQRHDGPDSVLLVDCLTVWLSNLMTNQGLAPDSVSEHCQALAEAFPGLKGRVYLVSGEVGMGLVPEYPLGRLFREQAGRLNQMVARACEQVVLVTAGLPLVLKGIDLED
jgi:adenosylcobinamide kinase/adenosylcobinamide-phosphate guanylyltransferase